MTYSLGHITQNLHGREDSISSEDAICYFYCHVDETKILL